MIQALKSSLALVSVLSFTACASQPPPQFATEEKSERIREIASTEKSCDFIAEDGSNWSIKFTSQTEMTISKNTAGKLVKFGTLRHVNTETFNRGTAFIYDSVGKNKATAYVYDHGKILNIDISIYDNAALIRKHFFCKLD